MRPDIVSQLKWYGAGAGAIVAIGGFVAAAAPVTRDLLDSGPMPFAGRMEIAATVDKALQQYDAKIQAQQQAISKDLDLNTLNTLLLQLTLAQHEAGKNPTFADRQYIGQIKDQINVIRAKRGLQPIQ